MLKKKILIIGVTAVLVGAMMIPPVRAAAVSALSVFRVQDTQTIRISVSDLQSMMTELNGGGREAVQAELDKLTSGISDKMQAQFRQLDSTRDFSAFDLSLPTLLEDETPMLYAADILSEVVVLDTTGINEKLNKLGAAILVDGSLEGTEITVMTPPVAIAEYQAVTLIATQGPATDAPDRVIDSLWASLISLPAIPENLRAQLAAVDLRSRNVYLPVIEGLGRATDLGGTTGYIYATNDLAQVLSMLPLFAEPDLTGALREANHSALIWIKNGVFYCLIGEKSDGELSQIARSIR